MDLNKKMGYLEIRVLNIYFKTSIFPIDRKMKECYKKLWGFYKFKPCECGCTSYYGIGIMLGRFGINIGGSTCPKKIKSY